MTVDCAAPVPTASTARGYRDGGPLFATVREAGLLERRRGYYAVKMAYTVVLLAAGWVAFAEVGNSWWQLLVAVPIAIAIGQCAYLMHDAGHRQIFSSRRANQVAGLVFMDVIVGASFGWWVAKHNQHHSHPNHVDLDPDLNVRALAFSPSQALSRRGILRWVARHQAVLLPALVCLEGVSVRISSVRALAGRRLRGTALEATLMLTRWTVFFVAILIVLPPGKALAFIGLQELIGGFYMGVSFAPNHKGMALIDDEAGMGFMQRQVITARNIGGGRLMCFILGGLNLQIEHHLFPTMPRANLLRVRPLVRSFCEQMGLPYHERTFLGSQREVLAYFHANGAPLRADRDERGVVPALSE